MECRIRNLQQWVFSQIAEAIIIIIIMLTDYNKVVNLLRQCTTSDVSAAENQLKRLASEDVRILNCLRQCLQDSTLQKNLHILAASTLSLIFASCSSQYTQEFCFKFLNLLLLEPAISITIKKQLSRSLMYCLQRCDQQYLDKWKDFTHAALLNEKIYDVGLLLLSSFACSEIRDNIIEELDVQPFLFGFSLMCKKIQQNSIAYQEILYILEVWKIVVEYLVHFCQDHARSLFMQMANSQNFCQALRFTTQTLSTGEGAHCLFLDAQNANIDTIEQIKKAALELQKLILLQITKSKNGAHTFLFQYTGLNIQFYVQTLCFVGHQPEVRANYQMEDSLIFMVEIVKILSSFSPEILCQSWKQTLHFLIFPLMAITEEELVDFEENTNSFVQLSEDICQKQKMGVLKTEVANFLEKITDLSPYIERYAKQYAYYTSLEKDFHEAQTAQIFDQGKQKINVSLIGKYVINYAIASIKHNLGMQFISKNEFLKEQALPQDAPILSVETSFLILSLYSYCLESYPKQIQDIRIILCHDKVKILPPLERTRIYVFLAYNYEQVFCLNSREEMQTLYFWIDLALREESHPTVSYCALDFVTNSLHKVYNDSTVMRVIQKIPQCQSPNFWALLKRMAHLFMGKISQDLYVELITQCFSRIGNEIQRQMDQQIKVTYVITCILNVFRIISQNGRLLSSMPNLRRALWEVKQIYQTARTHYFQDDIVKVLNSFLFYASKDEIQHPQMRSLLPYFIEDFVKQGYEPTHYYVAFNHFIMKGNLNNTVILIYETLKKSLQFFLGGKKKETGRKKIPIGHTLLLLQNLLAMHGDQLPKNEFDFLFETVKDLYPVQKKGAHGKQKLVIYDRTLLARALNLQYLCHMYHPNQQIIKVLGRYQSCKIYFSYDVGVLLSCIKLTLFKEKDMKNIFDLLTLCINVIYIFVEVDTLQKIEKVNELEKKVMRDSDEEHKIEEEENEEKNRKKSSLMVRVKKANDLQVILAYINTPFLKTQNKALGFSKNIKQVNDVRKDFIQLLSQVRNLNQALYQSYIGGLTGTLIEKIQTIVECKIQKILQGQLGQQKQRRILFKVKTIKVQNIDQKGTEEFYEDLEKEGWRPGFREKENEISEDEQELLKTKKAEKKKNEKKKLLDTQ